MKDCLRCLLPDHTRSPTALLFFWSTSRYRRNKPIWIRLSRMFGQRGSRPAAYRRPAMCIRHRCTLFRLRMFWMFCRRRSPHLHRWNRSRSRYRRGSHSFQKSCRPQVRRRRRWRHTKRGRMRGVGRKISWGSSRLFQEFLTDLQSDEKNPHGPLSSWRCGLLRALTKPATTVGCAADRGCSTLF